MYIDEAIQELVKIQLKHGNLKIGGGCLSEDITPNKFYVLNIDGCDINDEGDEAVEVYIS